MTNEEKTALDEISSETAALHLSTEKSSKTYGKHKRSRSKPKVKGSSSETPKNTTTPELKQHVGLSKGNSSCCSEFWWSELKFWFRFQILRAPTEDQSENARLLRCIMTLKWDLARNLVTTQARLHASGLYKTRLQKQNVKSQSQNQRKAAVVKKAVKVFSKHKEGNEEN